MFKTFSPFSCSRIPRIPRISRCEIFVLSAFLVVTFAWVWPPHQSTNRRTTGPPIAHHALHNYLTEKLCLRGEYRMGAGNLCYADFVLLIVIFTLSNTSG